MWNDSGQPVCLSFIISSYAHCQLNYSAVYKIGYTRGMLEIGIAFLIVWALVEAFVIALIKAILIVGLAYLAIGLLRR